ncbi:hypothetical protein C8N43_1217 [Litoreibacter ponti]|uniref:Uncharacterized protein n=1 Tax=Litoreibacter ponti TaxID=1510457 RepID=A0A2T6BKH7_9RHOB|nr:hypothetical protein [Litoreibacter ponti]PTX56558.1 hypothetical protein C8N43_1217 [Litoreibacter ponti]
MIRALLIASLLAGTVGCSLVSRDKSRGAEGERELPFKAKLRSSSDDRRAFDVSVRNKGAGLEEVRESVRFEATKYCLLNFGGSETEWRVSGGPDDWAFTQDGDALVFSGRCTNR